MPILIMLAALIYGLLLSGYPVITLIITGSLIFLFFLNGAIIEFGDWRRRRLRSIRVYSLSTPHCPQGTVNRKETEMINVKGPMGRAAYAFAPEEFRKGLGLAEPATQITVSWMRNRVLVTNAYAGVSFTLHDFKDALGIKDDRGEVVEVDIIPGVVVVVMSDKELSP